MLRVIKDRYNLPEEFFYNFEDLLDDDDIVNEPKKVRDPQNEPGGNEQPQYITNLNEDTVLETFFRKTDRGTGLCDLIAEAIITRETDPTAHVIVAPTEAGNFVNFQDVVDLEEKCFPHLFPHGVGGYLSTYQSSGVRYSNYRKQRLMGIDRRFVQDRTYMAFLLQIKEALDIKNSRVLFFRKSKTNRTKYNKDTLRNIDNSLERTDVGFCAYKPI